MSEETTNQNKPKRRLKAPAETVRQKQASALSKAERPTGVKRGKVRDILSAPFRKFASLSVWQSKGFKPVRFVGKWIGLIFWPPYFRKSFAELKLVTWPDRRQSWRLTFAVLAFATVFGVVIAGIDYGLDKLFKEVLLK